MKLPLRYLEVAGSNPAPDMLFFSTVVLRDKIHYYEAIEEGDKGNDEVVVHYIASVMMEQYTFKSQKKGKGEEEYIREF